MCDGSWRWSRSRVVRRRSGLYPWLMLGLLAALSGCARDAQRPGPAEEIGPTRPGEHGERCRWDYHGNEGESCVEGAACHFGYCWALDKVPRDSYLFSDRYSQDSGSIRSLVLQSVEPLLGPGDRVADLGAGSGMATFWMAARVGPTGRVYATDLDGGEVALVRSRAAQEGAPQIDARVVHGRRETGLTDLPKGTLKLIVMINSVQFTRDIDEARDLSYLRSLRDLLRPDGEIVYHQDWLWPSNLPRDQMVERFASAGLTLKGEVPLPAHIPATSAVRTPIADAKPDTIATRGFILRFQR